MLSHLCVCIGKSEKILLFDVSESSLKVDGILGITSTSPICVVVRVGPLSDNVPLLSCLRTRTTSCRHCNVLKIAKIRQIEYVDQLVL